MTDNLQPIDQLEARLAEIRATADRLETVIAQRAKLRSERPGRGSGMSDMDRAEAVLDRVDVLLAARRRARSVHGRGDSPGRRERRHLSVVPD